MTFHKRRINQEILKYYIDNNQLGELFNADSLIFEDEISSKIFDLYNEDTDICIIKTLYHGKGIEFITI